MPLADLRKLAIVENEVGHAHALGRGGEDFHARHQEGPVAHDTDDLLVLVHQLCADGGGHAIAHAVEVGGGDEAARAVHSEKFGSKERMVAVVHHGDGVVLQLLAQFVKEHGRVHAVIHVPIPFLLVGILVFLDLLGHALVARDIVEALRLQRVEQLPHGHAGIGGDAHLRGEIGAHGCRVDVDVDQVLRHRAAIAARGNFAKARAYRQQAVAILERVECGRHGGGAEAHAHVHRMRGGEGAQALQSRGHRRAEQVGKGLELLAYVHRTPAHEQAGVLGRGEQVCGLRNLARLAQRRHRGGLEHWHRLHLLAEELQVYRKLYQHRPRHTGYGGVVRLEDGGDDVLVSLNAPRPLGNGGHQLRLVQLVQLELVGQIRARTAGDDQHGDAVEEGLANAAHGMGDPRRRHDDATPNLALRRAADGIRNKRRPGLMRHQHRMYLVRVVQFVIQLGVVNPRYAERMRNGQLLHRIPRQPSPALRGPNVHLRQCSSHHRAPGLL